MHIVYLTVDLSTRSSGGIGSYVRTMASSLVERGHDATVVCAQAQLGASVPYAVVELDVDAHGPSRRLSLADAFRDAVLALHRHHPVDVVESTDYGLEGASCIDDPVLREAGVPTVVRMHTPDSLVCELNDEIRLADSPAVHAAEGSHFRATRNLSTPSRAMARELEVRWGVDPGRAVLLPNPVDIRALGSPMPAPPTASGEPWRLTFFGRLERRKGVHVLAEALRTLLPEHPRLLVELVGADTRTGTTTQGRVLREALGPWRDRVTFTGHLSGDLRTAALLRANAVCMPSLWENFPYACLEALAAGRPVIATSGSGFDEIVDDGVEGLLVPPGDADALAAAIDKMVSGSFQPPTPAELAHRVARFDTERLVADFERHYLELAA